MLRFAIPTGIVVGAAAYAAYRLTRLLDADATVAEARTTATMVVLAVGLWTLLILPARSPAGSSPWSPPW